VNDEARNRIAEATARGEDQDALHTLRWSLVWAAQAVARLAGTASESDAVEAVFLLDDALSSTAELTDPVRRLLRTAEPGPDVAAYLRDRQGELAETRTKTEDVRREHGELAKTEGELRERLGELAEVRGQVGELRRLERLVEALDDVQEQRGVIDERLTLLRERADGTEESMRLGSGDLLRLSEERLSRLDTPVRAALERAAEAQRELAEAEGELDDAKEAAVKASTRERLMRAEHEERLARLAAWERADRQVLDALAEFGGALTADGALEQARALIDAVETRLGELDSALGRALDTLDRDVSAGRTVVAWNDEGPAAHPLR
jgi:DNA repair exonuclease SbcCD ATPase subunit